MRRIVFGSGYAGSRVAKVAVSRGDEVVATVRSLARLEALKGQGFEVTTDAVVAVARRVDLSGAHVVICFPPDGETDAQLAPLVSGAQAITYLSSTGVYADIRGLINDNTPVPPAQSDSHARLLAAEATWRAVGATVLRAPGIYGADRGLHVRVISGAHRLPGDGSGVLSRIHVDDLAVLLLESARVRGETFVVGDAEPAPQRQVVEWICEEYGCPMPPSVPLEQVHETLRRDRRVDGRRALEVLGVTLTVPTWREGMRRPPVP